MKKLKKIVLDIETKKGIYQVVFRWDVKDKAYLVSVPSLPGVVTFGKNLADAKRMAKDAVELYCTCLIGEGNIIIDDKRKVIGKIPTSHIVAIR